MRLATLLIAGVLMVMPLGAAETIVSDLSQRRVAITADFDGSEILLFGAVKREEPIQMLRPLSVIITVSGPEQRVTVRRKSKVAGIWVNTDAVEVDRAPTFYAIATTRPMAQVLSDEEDLRHKITIPRAIRSVGAPMNVTDAAAFTEALIRIKIRNGTYQENPNTIAFFDQTLFKTSVKMPSNLVEGAYKVNLYLTRDRRVVAQDSTNIVVRKVGLERWIYNLAHERPLIYALLSIFIAISAGWAASAVFQRFRG